MKKIYLIFLSLIVAIIFTNLLFLYNISKKQVESYNSIVLEEGKICVDKMEESALHFENRVNAALYSDSFSNFFNSASRNIELTHKLELLYSTFPNFITNITVIDNFKHALSLNLDKNERFLSDSYTTHSQKKLCNIETIEFENDQYRYIFPIFKKNQVVCNIMFSVNYSGFFESNLQFYKTDEKIWQWVLDNSSKIVYNNSAFLKTFSFSQKPIKDKDSASFFIYHTITTNQGNIANWLPQHYNYRRFAPISKKVFSNNLTLPLAPKQ